MGTDPNLTGYEADTLYWEHTLPVHNGLCYDELMASYTQDLTT